MRIWDPKLLETETPCRIDFGPKRIPDQYGRATISNLWLGQSPSQCGILRPYLVAIRLGVIHLDP